MAVTLIKRIRKALTKLLWLVSLLIILFVLVLSIFKLTIPYWLEDKQNIIAKIEQSIGGKVDFESIDLNWDKFHPVLQLKDLSWNKTGINLQAEQTYLELKAWDTLLSGYLKTKNIKVTNAALKLELDKLAVENTDSGNINFSVEQAKELLANYPELLEQEKISLSNIEVLFKHVDVEAQLVISKVNFEKVRQQRQLVVESQSDYFENLQLVLESEGIPFATNSQLSSYFTVEQLDTKLLNDVFLYQAPFALESITTKAWVDYEADQLSQGRIELSGQSESGLVSSLDSIVKVQQQNGIYSFASEKYELVKRSEQAELETFSGGFLVELNLAEDDNHFYKLKANTIPVDYLLAYGEPFLSQELQNLLVQASPTGLIEKVDLDLQLLQGQLQAKDGYLELSDFRIEDTPYSPSLDVQKVSFSGTKKLWNYRLDGESTQLAWDGIFIEPIGIDSFHVDGSLDFSNSIKLNIQDLNFTGAIGSASAQGSVDISADNQVLMNLYAEAADIDVSKLYKVWPRNVMPQSVVSYLSDSLQSGKVDSGNVIWRGTIDDFPYTNLHGQFHVRADAQNVNFKFDSEWPLATGVNAQFEIVNEKILVSANQGSLTGSKLIDATAEIVDMTANEIDLRIKTKAQSEHAAVKELYLNSPLDNWVSPEIVNFEFDKAVTSSLDLNLLIDEEVDTTVKGRIMLANHQIKGLVDGLVVNKAKGVIQFDNNGVKSQNLQASVLDNPIKVKLTAGDYTQSGDLVQVDVQSQFDINKAFLSQEKQPPLAINGQSKFNLHYRLSEDITESLIVRSDLKGTEIIGPDWIAKKAEADSPLLVTMLKKGDEVNLRTVYRDAISSQLNFNINDISDLRGTVALGNLATESISMPEKGVAIEAHFDEVNAPDWLNALQLSPDKNTDQELASISWPDWIHLVKVTTPSLYIAGQQFTNVRFTDSKFGDEAARFNVFSEQGRGNLSVFKDGRKRLAVDYLNLDLKPFKEISQDKLELTKKAFANWQVECQKCVINEIDVGQITLISRLEDGVVKVLGDSQIAGAFGAYIEAEWRDKSTNFQIDFQSPSAATLLKSWGLGDGLRDTATFGSANVSWPGGFHQFSLQEAEGNLSIDAGEGSIRELSDKQARIFSLFSLQSLRRRLSLDFSDLFTDGFFYDSIEGRFSLKNGLVHSDKVFINGTAADVDITGNVNLISQQVDQRVTVFPKVDSSLPLIAGWALEPTTGIIMFLINKIFEPVIDVVTQIEYRITGDILEPEVIEVGKQSKQVVIPDEPAVEAVEESEDTPEQEIEGPTLL